VSIGHARFAPPVCFGGDPNDETMYGGRAELKFTPVAQSALSRANAT
jgi:hypothetical protein